MPFSRASRAVVESEKELLAGVPSIRSNYRKKECRRTGGLNTKVHFCVRGVRNSVAAKLDGGTRREKTSQLD